MSITPLPTAPAVTDTTSEFNTKAFNWVAALDTFTTEANAQAAAVDADAAAAAESASDALAAASSALATVGAVAWVSGTTYATGAAVYSPLNKQTYRRNSAGAGTTDPSLDAVNWTQVRLDPIDATQAEMEAGTETAVRSVSPLRIKQAIDSLASEVVGSIKSFANTSTSASYPGTKWKKMDNTTYLQANYPELYSKLGTVPNNPVSFTFSSAGGTISSNAPNAIIGPQNSGDVFVWVAPSNTFYTATDGITWTARSLPVYALSGSSYQYGNKVNNLYMAYGQITSTRASLLHSTNGITWTHKTINHSAGNENLNCGAYGNGVYVFGGSSGLYCTSTDLVTFTQRTIVAGSSITSIAFGNGVFVAAVQSSGMFSSTDGITWTARTSTSGSNLSDVIYKNNMFVAVGNYVAYSTDGITWSKRSSLPAAAIDITYAKGLFIALNTGYVAYSADAINWTSVTSWSGYSNQCIGADEYNGKFMIGTAWSGSACYKGVYDSITYNTSTEFVIPAATQPSFGTSVYIKAT